MNKEDLISRYKKIHGNVAWHIRTNNPTGEDLRTCERSLNVYSDFIEELKSLDEPPSSLPDQQKSLPEGMPRIVCLCGSTRFMDAFQSANLKLTMEGFIVLSVGCNTKSDSDLFGEMPEGELAELKNRLDELHKRKIDLADEIFVLNVGGYIGNSTRSEINYAIEHGKPIKYLEQNLEHFHNTKNKS